MQGSAKVDDKYDKCTNAFFSGTLAVSTSIGNTIPLVSAAQTSVAESNKATKVLSENGTAAILTPATARSSPAHTGTAVVQAGMANQIGTDNKVTHIPKKFSL